MKPDDGSKTPLDRREATGTAEAQDLVHTAEVSDPVGVPPGLPAWVTRELVALTLKVWQPRSRTRLSTADAVNMLLNVGRLIAAMPTAALPRGPSP